MMGASQQATEQNRSSAGWMGLFAAMSIGIGGMIGAGIFSILGVVAQAFGTAMFMSFLIGGVVALLSSYSYAKLGARYPSSGGAVELLVKGFGGGVLSGGINLYMWIGYVIALALYAQGFVGYAMTFLPGDSGVFLPKAIGVGIVLLFTAVNVVWATDHWRHGPSSKLARISIGGRKMLPRAISGRLLTTALRAVYLKGQSAMTRVLPLGTNADIPRGYYAETAIHLRTVLANRVCHNSRLRLRRQPCQTDQHYPAGSAIQSEH